LLCQFVRLHKTVEILNAKEAAVQAFAVTEP
jgi:hypothetical protein